MSDEIVNKVAKSGIVTLEPEEWLKGVEKGSFDLADHLWQGMVLKEKDFRAAVKETDWSQYTGQHVAVYCSADAIIQKWAWMLVASALQPYAKKVHFCTPEKLDDAVLMDHISHIDPNDYTDARIVLKGCSDVEISPEVYVALTEKLRPVVKMLMFGEPCSTVPVYKKPRPQK